MHAADCLAPHTHTTRERQTDRQEMGPKHNPRHHLVLPDSNTDAGIVFQIEMG